MSTVSLPLSLRAAPRVRLGFAFAPAVLAACAAFMFLNLRTMPIVLWDESRMVVNALEMHLSGRPHLVTTYGFAPDLWNTKPPLLIWLMDLSAGVFGPSEWSLRLPSMLASLVTLALVMSFTRRLTGSRLASATAAGLLATSISFFAEHGARTADYEALLCTFTTGYLYVIFFTLHQEKPRPWRFALIGLLVAGAVMTKGIAGLLPGLGVPAYLLMVNRWRRPLRAAISYAVGAAIALAIPAAYLVAREHAEPGYLHAMMFNDVSGRFGVALDRHTGPPWYYLKMMFLSVGFSAGPFTALAPLALASATGRARLAMVYCLCIAGSELAVLSASATKLSHYAMPILPMVAVASAIALREGLKQFDLACARGRFTSLRPLHGRIVAAGMLAMIAAGAFEARFVWLPSREFTPQALYGELFDRLDQEGVRRIAVIDGGVVKPGVEAAGVASDYAPQLDFYRELAVSRGLDVRRVAAGALAAQPQGLTLATCDPDLAGRVAAMGSDIAGVKGCKAVRR